MVISAVVAVALGVAPLNPASPVVTGDYSGQVGSFTQTIDRRGTTHVRGKDRRGCSYDITLDRHGYVEADVGDRVVTFEVRDAS